MLAPILVLLIVPAVLGLIVNPAAGLIVTLPVPVGLIVTFALLGLNPTVELASNVVNAPVLLVLAPILVLLIVLAVDGLIVNAPAGLIATVPVPVGLIVTFALLGLNPTVELASNVVKFPPARVVPPIVTLFIVPVAADVNVIAPVPEGVIETPAFAGLIVTPPAGAIVTVPVPVGLNITV